MRMCAFRRVGILYTISDPLKSMNASHRISKGTKNAPNQLKKRNKRCTKTLWNCASLCNPCSFLSSTFTIRANSSKKCLKRVKIMNSNWMQVRKRQVRRNKKSPKNQRKRTPLHQKTRRKRRVRARKRRLAREAQGPPMRMMSSMRCLSRAYRRIRPSSRIRTWYTLPSMSITFSSRYLKTS